MKKDFLKWHYKKEFLHQVKMRPYFYEGEIWFCSLGFNIGFEQDGKGEQFLRPTIIIKKFNKEIFLGVLLAKHKKDGKYYFSFKFNNQISAAILSQIRLIDGERLNYKIRNLNNNDFKEIKKRLAKLFA